MTTAIIFDLDDTLYPERQFAHGGFEAAALWAGAYFGLSDADVGRLNARMVTHLADGVLGPLFAASLRDVWPSARDEDLKAFIDAYGRAVPTLTLFPDAARFLHGPHGALARGLITDGHAPTQAKKVAALHLSARFSEIIYTGALGLDRAFHKPHPRAFELMEAQVPNATRLVYVGDNPTKDFLAPKARGWTTVRIRRVNLEPDALPIHAAAVLPPPSLEATPHFTIASIDELAAILELPSASDIATR